SEPDARGVQNAVLVGDPAKPGFYAVMTKWLKGNHFSRPHFHPNDRYITVLQGTWWVGSGPKFDPANTTPMPAGSFVTHFGKRGEVTLHRRRRLPAAKGPFEMRHQGQRDIFPPRPRRYLNAKRQALGRGADADRCRGPSRQIVHLGIAKALAVLLVEAGAVRQ